MQCAALLASSVVALIACAAAPPGVAPTPDVPAPPRASTPPPPELVTVPAGRFRMGDLAGDGAKDERPVHEVAVRAFALGRHEVTIGEFRRFVVATGYLTDAERNAGHAGCYGRQAPAGASWETGRGWVRGLSWQAPGYPVSERHPVACVSWNDVQAYLDWLSRSTGRRYRLPTEAEWEYAARAGSQAAYPWGDDPDAGCPQANGRDLTPWPDGGAWDQRMNCDDGHFSPAPVGSYAPNRFGLHEMIGNLSEWVEDCRHDDYTGAPADGSAWRDGGDCGFRLVRGGTFVYGPTGLRTANRVWNEPSYRVWYQGFRVVEAR
jgi:formylglycine-generating enzyme required for sulfatase activity